MEFIKNRLYINRSLQPAIIESISSNGDYPIALRLLNRTNKIRALTRDGLYIGSHALSQDDIVTEIPIYEYKNEHIINDIFHLSIYHSQRRTYINDNGISYDNKNCVINILSTYQIKNIKNKLENLHYALGARYET